MIPFPSLEQLVEGNQQAERFKVTSPDGRFVWVGDAREVRMSHWVVSGSLWSVESRACLLEPAGGWSCEALEWSAPATLRFAARRYPGVDPPVTLRIDAAAGVGWLEALDLKAAQAAGSYLYLKEADVLAPPKGPLSFPQLARYLA